MGLGDDLLLKLDQTVTGVLSEWDIYTTGLAAGLVSFFVYQVVTSRDPDAHPMLLSRQAQGSPVRLDGESAIFRAPSAPHGLPLNAGLGVKDPGDSKWSRGRDGDLRDIWRRVVSGELDREGKETGVRGQISTVFGTENIVKHDIAAITRQINLIGENIKQNGGKTVAIYLPNSVEFLAALFAASFYDLTAVLIPYTQPIETVVSILKQSRADTIIAAVGSFAFDVVANGYPALKQLIWVVDEGSAHLDWNEVPTGTGGAVNVSTWSEILLEQAPTAGTELPAVDRAAVPKNVLALSTSGELMEYTQANLVAGIAGQLTSVPNMQRITSADLFLPADSLTSIYALTLTLGALFSNASVALNSVASQNPNLTTATQGISPTIIVMSSSTLAKTHAETAAKLNSSLYRLVHWFQRRALVQQGVLPLATAFSRFYDAHRPSVGATPGKLRLIYASQPAVSSSTRLSAETLTDLRIYLRTRIIYALTAPKVAGAVAQTSPFDYRIDEDGESAHFGGPVSSVEVFFRDTKNNKTTDESSAGELVARGPAVVGGEAALGVEGRIRPDQTIALL